LTFYCLRTESCRSTRTVVHDNEKNSKLISENKNRILNAAAENKNLTLSWFYGKL